MTEPTNIIKCSCGAITIEINDKEYSMSSETFNEMFSPLDSESYETKWVNCNYCVNHWGVDLCGCGSGEPFGECDNNLEECKSPSQSIEANICCTSARWAF